MAENAFSTQRLAAAYLEATQAALPSLTKTVAQMTARWFREHTRYVIDYDRGQPWDDSGELIDTHLPFILENYLTLADFWQEYEGGREPTYESGSGWHYLSFINVLRSEFPHLLTPVYAQAIARLAQEEPTYYRQLVAHMQTTYDATTSTTDELLDALRFHDLVGDTEIQCEMTLEEHLQALMLVPLLQKERLPRRCQRSALEAIINLSSFMEELAAYCTTVAHVTSVNDAGPLHLHLERTEGSIVWGQYEGAREALMDHIAHTGSVILRANLAATDAEGQPLHGLRGWFIAAEAQSITPHRIAPDDLYEAMNTDAQTGAKLPPEPNVRYL